MKQKYTIEQFEQMTANEVRKMYKNGDHIWRAIDNCIALITFNENVRKALEDCEVEFEVEKDDRRSRNVRFENGVYIKTQRVGELEPVIASYGTVHQQIKAISYILGEPYEVIRKACWSMKFKDLLILDKTIGSFNPYMAMGRPSEQSFANVWL